MSTLKKIQWIDDNHMLFESQHKTFNRQVSCISTGNVIGKVQLSGYIRPYNRTECNGAHFPPGHLQEYDLDWLNTFLPISLKDWVRNNGKNQTMIGYSFFYYKGNKKIFIGWVITDNKYNHLKTVYARNTTQIISALEECKKYICN